MILEQVHFVDVEEAAIGAGEQAGLEAARAVGERALEVERADDAVLGRAERKVHHRHRDPVRGARRPRGAVRARRGGGAGFAIERAAGHRRDRRQKRGQRPDRGRFAGAAVAEHENAADPRVDRGEQERVAHLVLSDDRAERKGRRRAGRHAAAARLFRRRRDRLIRSWRPVEDGDVHAVRRSGEA